MTQHIDQKFILNLQTLVKKVLTDEARYVSRNEQKFAVLHNKVFSKTEEAPLASLQKVDRDFFNKYFYTGADQYTTALPDTPFTDSIEDQNFFFDQLHQQVKFCTYNFDRMDYLRPSYADEKATEPAFNADQSAMLVRGLIYPLVYSVEQREISILEKKKSAAGGQKEEVKTNNPFGTLADKILVQGQSGEFDVILTYAQLEEIAGQEDQLRKQSLDDAQVVKLLSEYIQKRFPGLNLKLTEQGKVVTFLSASGLSAGGNLNGKDAVKDPADLPLARPEGLSFQELLHEMKLRQARKLQYDAIISSNGNLSFSTVNFQVDPGNGIKIQRNGLSADLDQEGQGNVAVFFLTDHQGITAQVTVDTSLYRTGDKPDYHFKLYSKPEIDSPTNPKIKLGQTELPKLATPYLVLYKQMQAPADYDVAPEKPKAYLLYSTGGPKPVVVVPDESLDEEEEEKPKVQISAPLLEGALLSMLPAVTSEEKAKSKSPLPVAKTKKPFVMPKLSSFKGPMLPPTKKVAAPVEEEDEEEPTGLKAQDGTQGKITEDEMNGEVATDQPKGRPLLKKGIIVAASVGLPIAGALAAGITNMIMNFPPSS